MTKDNKNVNIWEILKERNKDLVAEIEKLRSEKNNNNNEDLTPFYERLIVDLKEIMERIIEYDDTQIDILYLRAPWGRERFNGESEFELLNRIEETLDEVTDQW